MALVVAGGTFSYKTLTASDSTGDQSGPSQPENCEQAVEDNPVTSAPSNDAGVTIVESGIVNLQPDKAYGYWSFGLIAENHSELIATDVTLTLTGAFDNGDVVASDREDEWVQKLEFPAIYPGQEIGTGRIKDDNIDAKSTAPDTPAELQVDVEVGGWASTTSAQSSYGLKLASEVTMGRPGHEEEFIGFSVSSGFCNATMAAVGQVFRDSDGSIIGGSTSEINTMDGLSCDLTGRVDNLKSGTNDNLCAPNRWTYRYPDYKGSEVQPDLPQTTAYPILGDSNDVG